MDNGEVIPGLNEDWTFAGAKMLEWMAGMVMLLLSTEFTAKPAKQAPVLVCIMIGTALGLALTRRSFPDEERGMRNACMTALGFCPPGIPAPAMLQPVWSGAPLRGLRKESQFIKLGLENIFAPKPDSEDEEEDILAANR